MYQRITNSASGGNSYPPMESRDHFRNGVSPKNQMSRYKLFLLLSFIAVLSFSSMAQDVIMLKTGADIEASVKKVGEDEIEYKKWDNPSGPTYFIRKSDVFMIKYQNGSKDVFNTTAQPQTPSTPSTSSTPSAPSAPSTPSISSTSSSDLQKEFYRISDDNKALLEFFKRNDFLEYHNRFKAACKMKKSANLLLGTGLGVTGAGVIFHILGKANAKAAANASSLDEALTKVQMADILMDTGTTLIVTGALSTIGSIPIYAIAGSKKKDIKNDFAREYFGVTGYSYQPKLNVGTTANGIGLTLNF